MATMDNKTPLVHDGTPPIPATIEATATGISEEEPKVPLEKSFMALLHSFLLHFLSTAITASLLAICYANIYWFDNEEATGRSVYLVGHMSVSQNDILNGMQFVAKVYEMFLLSSFCRMVLHTVRLALLGKNGLPLALLSTGFGIDSISNLFSKRGWASLTGRGHFTIFTVSLLIGTIIANVLGPISAILVVPKPYWWTMPNPFGPVSLPVLSDQSDADLWPARLTGNHLDQECFDSRAMLQFGACPISGFQSMLDWTYASSIQGLPPTVSMGETLSGVRRDVTARSHKSNNQTAVSMATSLTEVVTSALGSFWRLGDLKGFPISQTSQARIQPVNSRPTWQPLVQVECYSIPTRDGRLPEGLRGHTATFPGINNFSLKNTTWKAPMDLFAYRWLPSNTVAGQTLILWADQPDDEDLPSAGMVVYTPYYAEINGVGRQYVSTNLCGVDARWIASAPSYDASENTEVKHNVTDPLVFLKDHHRTKESILEDKLKWGVSDKILLDKDWADALNINMTFGQYSAGTSQWLLNGFIDYPKYNGSTFYHFNPAIKAGKHHSNNTRAEIGPEYSADVASFVATMLSLELTDAIARTSMMDFINGAWADFGPDEKGRTNLVSLGAFGSSNKQFSGFNLTDERFKATFPTTQNRFDFEGLRYGYGYRIDDTSSKLAVGLVVLHASMCVAFMAYTAYDFFFGRGHISSAWGDVSEIASLFMYSQPSPQLENTNAGIDRRDTWKKIIRIRETEDGHMSVFVGSQGKAQPRLRPGRAYGTIDPSTKIMREEA
jgi:hypothetical protein